MRAFFTSIRSATLWKLSFRNLATVSRHQEETRVNGKGNALHTPSAKALPSVFNVPSYVRLR